MVPAPMPLAVTDTFPEPMAPTLAYPNAGELNTIPMPLHVSWIAWIAACSGKLVSELNPTPFTLPVSPFGPAARIIRSSPISDLFPLKVMLKVFEPSSIPTDCPVVPVPTNRTRSGVGFPQVKVPNELQVLAAAGIEAAKRASKIISGRDLKCLMRLPPDVDGRSQFLGISIAKRWALNRRFA